jgi:hypothetical protein
MNRPSLFSFAALLLVAACHRTAIGTSQAPPKRDDGATDVALGTDLRWNGTSWSSVTSGTKSWLLGVWGSGANDVWAVGESGTILRWR